MLSSDATTFIVGLGWGDGCPCEIDRQQTPVDGGAGRVLQERRQGELLGKPNSRSSLGNRLHKEPSSSWYRLRNCPCVSGPLVWVLLTPSKVSNLKNLESLHPSIQWNSYTWHLELILKMIRLVSAIHSYILTVASTNSQIRARCIFPIKYIPYFGLLASTQTSILRFKRLDVLSQ